MRQANAKKELKSDKIEDEEKSRQIAVTKQKQMNKNVQRNMFIVPQRNRLLIWHYHK